MEPPEHEGECGNMILLQYRPESEKSSALKKKGGSNINESTEAFKST
jgi:hypothetical protein